MKKTLITSLLFVAVLAAASIAAFGQTALTQTTLSAAVGSATRSIPLTSATGVTANQTLLYIDQEALFVTATSGTLATVGPRGSSGTKAFAHASGAMVLLGPPPAFISYQPAGSCTNGQGLFLYSPVVNINTGDQWLCSTVTGKIVPGFNNFKVAPQVSTAVTSTAGKITPSGPLFHITGTAAITGFNIPVGFDPLGSGQVCVVPDAAFTTTTANNIALNSTGVLNKLICWAYDGKTGSFYPTY